MTRKHFLYVVILLLCFQSCVKDEPLNAEADIISATLQAQQPISTQSTVISNTTVVFNIKDYAGELKFAPTFTLTPGAVIAPESGTMLDFSTPQTYTVTSQDGNWKKNYVISVVNDITVADGTYRLHSFELADTLTTDAPRGSYHIFYEQLASGQKKYDWATANEGYNVLASTMVGANETPQPDFYPTAQISEGKSGKGVLLQTKSTGALGGLFGSPLAAGSLYLGTFQLTVPSINSTHFGLPFQADEIPKSVKGFFKYKAGDNFVVNNAPSAYSHDTWDAYALIFEASEQNNYLTGSHQFADSRIIAIARIDAAQRIETSQWTPFEMNFSMVAGKSFSSQKEYMYTIVFSSSIEGDKFNGAVGSQLWIDEVEIVKN